jgi:hypothetical protein
LIRTSPLSPLEAEITPRQTRLALFFDMIFR